MPGAARNLRELEELLGHQFRDPELLERALTHPSLEGELNYERLEFLGTKHQHKSESCCS